MNWIKSSVATAAIVAVASGSLVPEFTSRAAAQETTGDQQSLEDLVGQGSTELAAVPDEEFLLDEELEELVAPVALYPDALLAQVLVASTFPLQIVKADRLLAESEGLTDDELADKIGAEEWDPSVLVLLTGFPTVIQRMAADLDWTERLGAAMVAQDADVLEAVQRKRAEALDTGYLANNEAQVVDQTDDQIYIRPADPEVVYVPSYDPSLAYTSTPTAEPYIAPRNNPIANPLVAGAIAFGAGLLVTEFFGDDDDNDNQGWNDYWRRPEPIHWRDRQFYPRPHDEWRDDRWAWSRERDSYWNRDRGWAYDQALRERRAADRREALALVEQNRELRAERLRDLRRAASREERQRAAEAARAAAEQRERRHAVANQRRAEQRAEQRAEDARLERQQRQRKQHLAEQRREEQARQNQAAHERQQQQRRQQAARDKQQQEQAARQKQQREEAAPQKQKQEKAARQKQQQEQAQAAVRQKEQQEQAQAAARQKQQQEQAQAAARKKQQQEQAQAAARKKQQQEQAQAAARKKQQQEQAQAAARKKQQQEQAQAAARKKQQAQAAARQKQQAQAAARQKQQAQAAAREKQQAAARERQRSKPAQKPNRCRNGQGKDCPRN